MRRPQFWIVCLFTAVTAYAAYANNNRKEPKMYEAARAFLGTLTEEQKQKAVFPFQSEERLNWHFVPKDRNGLPYKAMTGEQKQAAQNLLRVGLSQTGYKKTSQIRQLETVLHELENNNPIRDTELYYFTIFGEPSEKGTWGWRYEGHHVSLNWTVLKGKVIASSPQFLGTNPAEVRSGALKGLRILSAEEDIARALLHSLSDARKQEAVLSDKAPNDILTSAQRKAAIQEDKGVAFKSLTKEQQGLLLSLIQEYASTQNPELAKQRLDALRKAGLDTIKFGWMGGAERGQPHYYRVQGATFLIEYDNTQNNANHVHTVWRDFKGDFGADLLEEHYKTAEKTHGHDH